MVVTTLSRSAASISLPLERRGFKKAQDGVRTDTAADRRSALRVLLDKEGALPVVVLRSYLQAERGDGRLIDVKTVMKLVQEMVKDGDLASIDDDSPIRQGHTLAVVTSPKLEANALQVTRLFAALATGETTWRKIASRLAQPARDATRARALNSSTHVPTEQEQLDVAAKRDYLQGLALRLGWVPGRAVRAQRLHGILLVYARRLSAAPLIEGDGDGSAAPMGDCSAFAPLRIDDMLMSMAVIDFLMLLGIGDEPPDTEYLLHIVRTSELEPLATPLTIGELPAVLRDHLFGSANSKRRLHHLLTQLQAVGLLEFDPGHQPRSVVLHRTAALHARSATAARINALEAGADGVSPLAPRPPPSHVVQQFELAVAQESEAFWEVLHSHCQNKRAEQRKRHAKRGLDSVLSALPHGAQAVPPSQAFKSFATAASKAFPSAADWSGVRPLTPAQRRLIQGEFGVVPAAEGFSTAHGHDVGADIFVNELDQLQRPSMARPTTSGELHALANRLQVHPLQLRHYLLLTDVKAAQNSRSANSSALRCACHPRSSKSNSDERRGTAASAISTAPVQIKMAAAKKTGKRQRVSLSQRALAPAASTKSFMEGEMSKVDWAPTQRIELFEGFVNELIRLLTRRQPSSRAVAAATAHEAASSSPSDEVLQYSAARAGVELVVGFAQWDAISNRVGQPAHSCRMMLHRMLVSSRRSTTSANRSLRVCLAAVLIRKLMITEQALRPATTFTFCFAPHHLPPEHSQ